MEDQDKIQKIKILTLPIKLRVDCERFTGAIFTGFPYKTLKYWVSIQQGHSYLMGEGTSLALVGHPSSSITIKIPLGVDALLHQLASYPIFSYWAG